MDGDTIRNVLLGVSTVIGTITPIILLMMKNKQDLAILQATKAAEKVAEVAADVKTTSQANGAKLDEIAKVGEETKKVGAETHELVNSAMGEQLRLGMDLSEFKAATTKRPEDVLAAKLARAKYEEHMARQADVDFRKKQKAGGAGGASGVGVETSAERGAERGGERGAARGVEDVIERVVGKVSARAEKARDARDEVKDASRAQAVEQAASDMAKEVGKVAERVAERVERVAEKAAEQITDAAREAKDKKE